MAILFLDIMGKSRLFCDVDPTKTGFLHFPTSHETHCRERGRKEKTCSCSGLGDFAPWVRQGLGFWRY